MAGRPSDFSLEQLRVIERALQTAVWQTTLSRDDRSVIAATLAQVQGMIRGAERREAG
jgi:hypothetical protein